MPNRLLRILASPDGPGLDSPDGESFLRGIQAAPIADLTPDERVRMRVGPFGDDRQAGAIRHDRVGRKREVNNTVPFRFAPAHPAGYRTLLYGVLPLPPELPAGLAQNPRVLQLIDLDSVSYGLAHGTSSGRASDQEVQLSLEIVQATAWTLDPQSQVRCAASTATAAYHLNVLTSSGNNQWRVRCGLGGASQALLEAMADQVDARLIATGPGRKHSGRHADLVILVAQDRIYMPPVRQLRLLGIPTWLMVPGRRVAPSLYACSCAVSFLGPDSLDPEAPGGELTPCLSPLPLHAGKRYELRLAPALRHPLWQSAGSSCEVAAGRRDGQCSRSRVRPQPQSEYHADEDHFHCERHRQ